MNTKILFVATLAAVATLGAAATSAWAQEATYEYPQVVSSTLTRAQVRAETLEAIRVGAITRGEETVVPTPAQLESIRRAGLKAIATTTASR